MAQIRCMECPRCLWCLRLGWRKCLECQGGLACVVRLGRVAGICLITALVAGCYDSNSPLDSAPQTDLDARIVGGWRCMFAEPDGNDVFAMEVKSSGNRRYQVTTMMAGGNLSRYEAYASVVKGAPLVNVHALQAEPDEKPWLFLRCELVKPDLLHVRAIRDDAMKGSEDSAQAIRKILEQTTDDSETYEDAFVCMRLK